MLQSAACMHSKQAKELLEDSVLKFGGASCRNGVEQARAVVRLPSPRAGVKAVVAYIHAYAALLHIILLHNASEGASLVL